MNPIYTVGHSNHTEAAFLALLKDAGITAIADVRSTPHSRFNPHFDREPLKIALAEAGIHYVFLGRELGARTDDRTCYLYGKVQYDRLAQTERFQSGLTRVREGGAQHTVALLCAEKEPLDCHRTILVSRHLAATGADIRHLHPDGRIEPHAEALDRLIDLLHLRAANQHHLFYSQDQWIEDAYRLQEQRIAFDAGAHTADAA